MYNIRTCFKLLLLDLQVQLLPSFSHRSTFPQATVLPKMHFLEDHTVFWTKKWRSGFGFLGERGGESFHKQFNNALEHTYNCIPNKVERLHHIMESHNTQVCLCTRCGCSCMSLLPIAISRQTFTQMRGINIFHGIQKPSTTQLFIICLFSNRTLRAFFQFTWCTQNLPVTYIAI